MYKGKCKALHLARNNHMHWYRSGAALLERSTVEKDLVALMAVKANGMLGCIKRVWPAR